MLKFEGQKIRPNKNWLVTFSVIVLLAGLPFAVWLDLQTITENLLGRQAVAINSAISSIRNYYGLKVVDRVLSAAGSGTQVSHEYETIRGAIPIPATLSLELGKAISEQQSNVVYRFISDFPFKNRAPHNLDTFERVALENLRSNSNQLVTDASTDGFASSVRIVSPVIMGATCVNCHNSHPESEKRDWKIGDVRGIQEITVRQPIVTGLTSFKYLLTYFFFASATGCVFIYVQRKQSGELAALNTKLHEGNSFLSNVSGKVSKYLSPQIYQRIFSGQSDASVRTERKKLTIFFSDIVDFTSTTESTQPEQLTALLNEYFTEMSVIALKYGGTIDKFFGDAIMIFFGDPESKGETQDAMACVRMACEMQSRVAELNVQWKLQGVKKPFLVRMGINSGYCNVGNFGSDNRMDYTIIGAEANLAARLQSAAEPGRIVLSYETYALVRELVIADALPEITLKGISRPVIPYIVNGMVGVTGTEPALLSENNLGFSLYLDVNSLDIEKMNYAREVLAGALKMLDRT